MAVVLMTTGSEVVFAQTSVSQNGNAGTTGPGDLRPIERAFIVQTLTTSRDEAELSSLAATHARSSDIRDFAQQLVADYRQINTALESLARRKTVDVPLQPTSYSDHYRSLVENSGNGFDRAFIQETAAINDRTMRLLANILAQAKDPEVRDFAGSILPVIRDHANKIKEIQKTF